MITKVIYLYSGHALIINLNLVVWVDAWLLREPKPDIYLLGFFYASTLGIDLPSAHHRGVKG